MNELSIEARRVSGSEEVASDSHVVRGVLGFPTEPDPKRVLLGNGWLRRADCATLISTAGNGKSVGIVQAAISWGLGLSYFGIKPAGPLRIIIFSGEDDDVTLGQCRDGLLDHSEAITGRKIDRADLELLNKNVRTDFSREHVGHRFHERLEAHLAAEAADLVLINPLMSYVGGDVVKEGPTWLRAGLLPILQERQIGAILAHHTNRMARDSWENTDDVYSGIGGGEIANIPRSVLTLRPTKAAGLLVLKVGKRKTTGWKDEEGKFSDSFFLRRSDDPSRPAWIPVPHGEAAEILSGARADNRLRKCSPGDIIAELEPGKISRPDLLKRLQKRYDCSEATAKKALQEVRGQYDISEWTEKNPNGGKDILWLSLPEHRPKGQNHATP